jgi:hypothetical protein
MIRLGLAVTIVLAAACGSNAPNGPCDVSPPDPACMQACDPLPGAPNDCPPGFHCSPAGTCTAQCTQGGDECGAGNVCTADGHCVPGDGDASLFPDADCPNVDFTAERVTPTIQLLIDKSGSMDQDFDGDTRWEAMRQALIGAGGVVNQYQASVYFGATLYSQTSNSCPNLVPNAMGTGRALNNAAAIATLINANGPGGGTPTGPSLMATYMDMVANPPPAGSPPIIILATDGQPFICPDNTDNPQGQQLSIAAAQAAFTAGIQTFVLGVAPSGDGALNAHLQQVANAGAGMDPQTGNATYYPADSPQALAMAFDTIIGGVVSCDLMINGSITQDQAAAGQVRLNGMLLTYGTDWVLVGDNIIRLQGAACTTLMGTSMPNVTASFPCGIIID